MSVNLTHLRPQTHLTESFNVHGLVGLSRHPKNDSVAVVMLDMPGTLNALSKQAFTAISHCFGLINKEESIRVVIIMSSTPGFFCSGIDFHYLNSILLDLNATDLDGGSFRLVSFIATRAKKIHQEIQFMQDSLNAIYECKKPTIALIDGICYGAGMEHVERLSLGVDLVCCADMRLCTKNAKFSVKEVDLGLAADLGTLQRLPKCISSSGIALELSLTGRVWNANEAQAFGFTQGNPREDYARLEEIGTKLAVSLASKSQTAIENTKQSIRHAYEQPSIKEGLREIALVNSSALQSIELSTNISAFLTRSKL